MGALNKVMLIGNLGKDPESKMAGSAPVCNFSVAVTERYKSKDGQQQEKTEWVNIVCWNNVANLAGQYLKKGSNVYIEGKLQTRSWDQDGVKRYSTEVQAFTIQFLDSKKQQSNNAEPVSADDCPF